MCIVALALNAHPRFPLIVAANRDEFFARPTAPAAFWKDAPWVLAGRDLAAGGTWLGVTRRGRFAAVTYFREGVRADPGLRSRGLLTSGFLTGNASPDEYLECVAREQENFGGFNLLVGSPSEIRYLSNRSGGIPSLLDSGVHAVSNGPLDSSWPKVAAARERLTEIISADRLDEDSLFTLLADTECYPDEYLPETGIGIERERFLSPIFINGGEYGTRSSTVVLFGANGAITFIERTFGPAGSRSEVREEILPR